MDSTYRRKTLPKLAGEPTQVCSQVALAAAEKQPGLGSAYSGAGGSGFRGGLDEGLMDGGDDEMEEGTRVGGAGPPARGPPTVAGDPTAVAAGETRVGGAPRLRTRLFAAQCDPAFPAPVSVF